MNFLLFVEAWLMLAAYDLAKSLGHSAVSRRRPLQRKFGQRRDPGQIGIICETVDLATCFYFKQVRCMQRASVLVGLLRRRGFLAELVIGYRHNPFLAHAWVEVNASIVGDSIGYRERLRVLYKD